MDFAGFDICKKMRQNFKCDNRIIEIIDKARPNVGVFPKGSLGAHLQTNFGSKKTFSSVTGIVEEVRLESTPTTSTDIPKFSEEAKILIANARSYDDKSDEDLKEMIRNRLPHDNVNHVFDAMRTDQLKF